MTIPDLFCLAYVFAALATLGWLVTHIPPITEDGFEDDIATFLMALLGALLWPVVWYLEFFGSDPYQ